MTTIQFDGLVFDDSVSVGLTIARLTGWWDAPQVRRRANDRPQADGAYGSAKNWRAGRTVGVEGSYVGTNMADTYEVMDRLAALQSSGVASVFRVTEPFGSKQIVAELANGPTLPDQIYQPFFTFAFDVFAPDPLRYGDAVTSVAGVPMSGGGLLFPLGTTPTAYWDFGADGQSGRASGSNPGKARTYPTIAVTGGLELGFVITDVTTGQVVRFDRPVPLGSTVTINQRTGRASIDGQGDVSGFLTSRDFFSVGPGETHLFQFSPLGAVTGTPQAFFYTSPAFW